MPTKKPSLDEKIINQLSDLQSDNGQSNLNIILGTLSSVSNLKNRPQIMLGIIQAIAMLTNDCTDFDIDELDELEPAIDNLMSEPSPSEDLIDLSDDKKS